MRNLPFIKGVNLGGWLVLEKWMTPTLFEGVEVSDEYSLMQTSGGPEKVRAHQMNFITSADWRWLEKSGVNSVRIPVGYWVFDGDGPFVSCIDRLDWAVKQAKKHGLLVLIDLHAAPGGQNGQDHSGHSGKAMWYKSKSNRSATIDVLVRLAARYKDESHVFGLELLNEPRPGLFQLKLRAFYKQAERAIRAVARPDLIVVFHDAFMPRLMLHALKSHKGNGVMMDHHWYQGLSVFARWQTLRGYFAKLQRREKMYIRLQKRQRIIVGEWSLVLPGHLIKGLSWPDELAALREHERLQRRAFAHTSGWFYWSYKHEKPGIWDFRSQVEDGMIEL